MKRNVVAFAILAATMAAGTVLAVQQDIQVLARMRIGLSFANKVDMDFTPSTGHIDFYGAPDASTDFVNLATSGAITVNGTVFEPSSMTGTPGSVDINSDGTSSVYISCTPNATLANVSGAHTMTVDSLQIKMNTGGAFNAQDYDCDGLSSVTPYSYTLTGSDKILVGGRLVGDPSVTTSAYSTANTNGVAATVKVIYQ